MNVQFRKSTVEPEMYDVMVSYGEREYLFYAVTTSETFDTSRIQDLDGWPYIIVDESGLAFDDLSIENEEDLIHVECAISLGFPVDHDWRADEDSDGPTPTEQAHRLNEIYQQYKQAH